MYYRKDLNVDELTELNNLKTTVHNSENSMIPNNDEFNSAIKVKVTDPQPETKIFFRKESII